MAGERGDSEIELCTCEQAATAWRVMLKSMEPRKAISDLAGAMPPFNAEVFLDSAGVAKRIARYGRDDVFSRTEIIGPDSFIGSLASSGGIVRC